MALFSHTPQMKHMFTGLDMATRPIPVFYDQPDRLAVAVAASEQRPRGDIVNMPSRPSVMGVEGVFGTPVGAGNPNSPKFTAGIFNPSVGRDEII